MMNSTRFSLLKKTLVALVVVVLNFAKQIGAFLVEENRYYMLWRFTDGLALVLDVVVLAALAVAISQTLHVLKWDRARKAYNHLFLLALALGMLSLLPESILHPDSDSPRAYGAVLAIVAIVAFSLGYPRSRLVHYAANLCLVFAPLVLILSYQLLSGSTWATDPEPRPNFQAVQAALPARPGAHPVFFFVFDEWSYQRTTENGEFLPSFVHLNELSAESFNFRHAQSQSSQTKFSLPAILFQTDQTLRIEKGHTFWESEGNRVPTTAAPSLFTSARAQGYHTALLGFYLPYRKMLGDQVDYCRSLGWYPKHEGLVENMAVAAVRNLQYMEEPVSLRKRQTVQASIESQRYVEVNREILQEALQLIEDCPRNTLAFFHWPLPHGPFVLNADGTYRGPYIGRGTKFAAFHGTVEDYQQHLLYMDTVIRQIIERLKKSGKYDDALLIFTADHSWRYDPLQDSKHWKTNPAMRIVPLLIKMPGQKSRHWIEQPIKNTQLQLVIDQVLRGEATESTLQEFLDRDGVTALSSR